MNNVHEDPIAEAVALALRDVIEGEGKKGWDQPPSLWIILRNPLITNEKSLTVPLAVVEMDTGPFFTMGTPADQLAWLAQKASTGTFKQPTETGAQAIGFAFLTEAWVIAAPKEGFSDEALAATRNRQIKTLPERIEVRIVSAVDTSGTIYSLMVPRDPTKFDRTETHARPGEQSGTGAVITGGYVIDSLTTLVESIDA